jgi:hypothetical protein
MGENSPNPITLLEKFFSNYFQRNSFFQCQTFQTVFSSKRKFQKLQKSVTKKSLFKKIKFSYLFKNQIFIFGLLRCRGSGSTSWWRAPTSSAPTRSRPGTDFIILKIFSPKNFEKILVFFAQITASFCENLIITLIFEKNANFLNLKIGKNRRKLWS